MRTTDAQVHVWETHIAERPAHMGPNFTVDRLLQEMVKADVDRVVLVPTAKASPEDTKGGNEYPLAAAQKWPKKFAVMGLLDLGQPDSEKNLVELLARPGVKGVRMPLRKETPETLDWIGRQALDRDFPIAVLANRGNFERLAHLVNNHPGITVLLDHVAVPAPGPDPFASFEQVLALEKHRNLVVKSSGMSRWSKESYPFRDIHNYIRRLRDTFGPERMAWGSDYSWEVGRIPYRETVDLFREACDFLSASDREWILDKTLSRVLRWN